MSDRLTKRIENAVVPNGHGIQTDIEQILLDQLAAYEDIGTPEQFAKLMKAKAEGRIAECTCGECEYFEPEDRVFDSCDGFCILEKYAKHNKEYCRDGIRKAAKP